MTTGTSGLTGRLRWRGGCTDTTSTWFGIVAGAVALWQVTFAAGLYLHNSLGPLGDSESAGTFAALGCGAAAALAMFVVIRSMARRSRAWLVAALTVATAVGWVLMPRQIDVSESWVPRPNARYACVGWTFRHYPPATYDASETTYCVGLEQRIPDG